MHAMRTLAKWDVVLCQSMRGTSIWLFWWSGGRWVANISQTVTPTCSRFRTSIGHQHMRESYGVCIAHTYKIAENSNQHTKTEIYTLGCPFLPIPVCKPRRLTLPLNYSRLLCCLVSNQIFISQLQPKSSLLAHLSQLLSQILPTTIILWLNELWKT